MNWNNNSSRFFSASFYISSLVAYFYPIIGIYFYQWDIIEVVFLYIVEAALLFIYHIFINTKKGLPSKNVEAKKDYFNVGIFFVELWELFVIILAFTMFQREFEHSFLSNQSSLWYMFKVLWVPVLFLIITYTLNIIDLFKDKNKTFNLGRPLSQWFWQIFAPLLISMFLLNHFSNSLYFIKDEVSTLYGLIQQSRPSFWLVFWIFIIASCKFIAEIIDQKQNKKDDYDDKPNILVVKPHPFSALSLLKNSLFVMYLCTAFMALSPSTMDQKWGLSGAIIFLVGLAVVIIAVGAIDFKLPFKTYLILDKTSKKIILRRKFLSKEILKVIELSRIKKISLNYVWAEGRGRMPSAYCIRTNNLKPLIINTSFFSHIELYNFFEYIKENYTDFDVALPDSPPKSHFGL